MSKPEPLRGKKQIGWNQDDGDYTNVYIDIDDVKSAVEFYKRYRDNITLLKKDIKGIHSKFPKESKDYLKENKLIDWKHFEIYNNWLFDYCFEDCINE